MPNSKWLEFVREKIPLHTIAPLLNNICQHSQKLIGKPFRELLVYYDGQKMIWGNGVEDCEIIGKYLLRKFNQNSARQKYFTRYLNLYKKNNLFCAKYKEYNFKKLSLVNLIRQYQNFIQQVGLFHAQSFDIDPIDLVLDREFKQYFKKLYLKKHQNFNEKHYSSLINILTTPLTPSYLQAEEQAVSKHWPATKLVEHFWWTQLTWTTFKIKDLKYFKKQLKTIKYNSVKKINKQQIIKDYHFDSKMNLYLAIFEQYAAFHDYRKEIQLKSTYVLQKFLKEFSRRLKIPKTKLEWLWPEEIIKISNNQCQISNAIIQQRQEKYLILQQIRKRKEYLGKYAQSQKQRELGHKSAQISDFSGVITSKGTAQGRVKVCFSSQEAIRKIKPGDILVAGMTMPDYLPAMQRAAAVVTDEGGITCHAGIISREIGIPCIVGTKIATKILKDGDMVEVRANHGIIKLL